jgi:hypothetical protein
MALRARDEEAAAGTAVRRRPTEAAAGSNSGWEAGSVRVALRRQGAAVVVSVHGPVRPEDADVHRAAVLAASTTSTTRIVLDLADAVLDDQSVPLLALTERHVARHEGTMWVADLPAGARGGIDTARSALAFRVLPTVAIAVGTAALVPVSCRGRSRHIETPAADDVIACSSGQLTQEAGATW